MKDFKGKGKPFQKSGNDFRRGGNDFKRNGKEGFSFDRGADKELFEAICANCGNKCQVPFKPTGRKPVLCRNCFRNEDSRDDRDSFKRDDRRNDSYSDRSSSGSSSQYSVDEQLKRINQKLDQILRSL